MYIDVAVSVLEYILTNLCKIINSTKKYHFFQFFVLEGIFSSSQSTFRCFVIGVRSAEDAGTRNTGGITATAATATARFARFAAFF